ncbi:MAG: sigma-70 family RNA polymerase sigma factor [Kiritimatiellae bacterium]|nr:sigma-70 family RNA polymerase sigma factor [Kiritimatiellia bacterium]
MTDLPIENVSDEILMGQFCEKLDEDAFRAVAVRYYDSALNIARSKLGNEALAQDAVQEAFIRIVKHRKRYNPSKLFAPWFYTILNNICIDFRRREVRYRETLNDFSNAQEDKSYGGYLKNIVRDLLDSLSRADKNILMLRYIDGLSFAEISKHSECSLDAAKKRVQRALRRVKTPE